jgi:hypothetical protein
VETSKPTLSAKKNPILVFASVDPKNLANVKRTSGGAGTVVNDWSAAPFGAVIDTSVPAAIRGPRQGIIGRKSGRIAGKENPESISVKPQPRTVPTVQRRVTPRWYTW